MANVIDFFRKEVKNWWISLLVGILAIVVGIWCLASPDVTLVSMTYVFIAAFFIGGFSDIIFSLSNRKYIYGWGWTFVAGIFEVLMAVLLLSLPLPAVTVILIYLVGFWILFRSLMGIAESCSLQLAGVKGWGWLLTLGILGLLFSFCYLLSPVYGGVFVVALVGVAILCYGIFRIILAVNLRKINKTIKEITKE